MKIAHLILAHIDADHIKKLVKRLIIFSDVFIHIDANSNIDEFKSDLKQYENCYFLEDRHHCEWGGINAVRAELKLIKMALEKGDYNRLVFLQGADYPLKSNREIIDFFKTNSSVEFIRACCVTDEADTYFYDKCRYYLFYNNKNFIKKIFNKITRCFHIKLRDGYIRDGKEKYRVFWGSAQWALTGNCAKYILDFYENHLQFNKWFYHAFPADELYIQTVVMNSPYRDKTLYRGPESPKRGLSNWRNLHYFEYLPGKIRIFTDKDFEYLHTRSELYIRKVNSNDSSRLIEMFDKCNT